MRCWLLVTCCLSAMVQPVRADDAETPATVPLRALIVPPGRPEAWPQGDWLGVPADDYGEFVDWLNRAGSTPAPSTVVGVAEYSGEFDGHDRITGELTFEIEAPAGEAGLVPLGEFSPRIQNLQWEDGAPAVWGAAADQASYLWTDRVNGGLTAEWFQQGVRFIPDGEAVAAEGSGFVRFDLTLPSAVSSRLKLRIPVTRHLDPTAGIVSGTRAVGDTGFNEWTIECGPSGRLTFVISDAASSAARPPWLADLTTLATAKSDGLHFDAELTVESSDALPEELSLRIPLDLKITSVRTASDAAVDYQVSEDGPRNALRIAVADADTRRGVFRIRGIMPLSLRRPMVFPFVAIPGAAAVTSTWALKVDQPLEIKDITPQGLRQTGLTVGVQGENWRFIPLHPEPRLAFEVGLPETVVDQQTWSLVDLTKPVPELNAVTSLQCVQGTIYASEWALPAEWTIAGVRSPDVVISSWTCDPVPESGTQTLRVEYRDPVAANDRIAVEITAKSRPWHVDESHPLPVIECLDGDARDSKFALRYPPGMQWRHDAASLSGPFPIVDSGEGVPGSMRDRLEAESREQYELWESSGEEESALCRLTREATGDDAESLREFGQLSETAADESTATGESLRCELSVETHVAGANRSHHRHQCIFELLPHRQDGFQFTLEQAAEVLRIYCDGQQIEPRIQDDVFHVAISPGTKAVQIDYLTPAASGIMSSDLIPIPQSNFACGTIEWRFLLPADRGVAACPADVVVVQESGRLSLAQRLLGPLARTGTETPSGSAGSDLEGSGVNADADSQRTLALVARGDVQRLRLDLWDVKVAHSATWTSLLGAFLLMLTLRRSSPIAWKSVWLAAIALAFATAWFATPPLAITAGGALMGSLLAAAIPRRIVHPSTAGGEPVSPADQRSSLAVSGTAGILLACCAVLSGGRIVAAQSDPPPAAEPGVEYDLLIPADGDASTATTVLLGDRLQRWYAAWQTARRPLPTCLINAARYQVAFAPDSLPLVAATLEVFIPAEGNHEILLPFRNVVVVGSTEATIDGRPVSLIPESGGNGFLLTLPVGVELPATGSTVVDTPQQSPVYRPATIDLTFRVRPSDAMGLQQEQWAAGVPRVAQTDVVLAPEQSVEYDVEGSTRWLESDGEIVAPLPPSQLLAFSEKNRTLRATQPRLSASSTVELGPGLSTVQAEFMLRQSEVQGGPLVLPISLPPESIVRDVQPTGEIDYFVDALPDALVVWLVLPRPDAEPESVTLEYSIVSRQSPAGEWLLPPLAYHSQLDRHRLEITPRAGYRWDHRPRSSPELEILGSDEVADDAIAISTPETIVAILRQSGETSWSIEAIEPARKAVINERLELHPDSCTWTANLAVESSAAPFFEYDCGVDPGIEIDSVSVRRDGADRLLRWNQTRDRLKIFVEGDQPGTHDVVISGTFPTSPGSAFQYPRFDVSEVEIESRDLRLINRGDATLRWDAAGQGAAELRPGEEISLKIDPGGQGAPANLQFESAGERVHVSQTIWMMPAEHAAWTIWQRLVFTNQGETFPRQTIRIPEAWEHVSVQASGGEAVNGSDLEGEFIRLDGAEGDTVELDLLTRLGHAESSAPLASVDQLESSLLLLPGSVAINSTEWREDATAGVPEAPEGFASVGEWAVYRPRIANTALPMLPDPDSVSGLRVLHAETDVFVSAEAVMGETRYDVSAGSSRTLTLSEAAGSTIQSVSIDGARTKWDEQSPVIPIPKDRRCLLVAVKWTAPAGEKGGRDSLAEWIPLLAAEGTETHFVCCWNQGAAPLWLPADSVRVTTDELWLNRWAGLYQVADRSGSTAGMDRLLLWRIGRCEAALSGSDGHDAGTPTRRNIHELRDRWNELKRSWNSADDAASISVTDPVQTRMPGWELARRDDEAFAAYRITFNGDATAATMPIPPGDPAWRRIVWGSVATLLLVIVGGWMLRLMSRLAWNDRLASHPQLAWTLIGLVWWLCLSPSIVGVVILLLVAAHVIRRLVSGRAASSRRPSVPSTVTR